MRKTLIAGNWKMNHTNADAAGFLNAIKHSDLEADRDVVLFPPFTALSTFQSELISSDVEYGAQNMHWEESGAYTGEVSAAMLQELDCTYVLIGHSERRQYFSETDEMVNTKLKAALAASLTPVVCVGEDLELRKGGAYIGHVETQVRNALEGIDAKDYSKIVFAYEPIWAIGTGETATPEQAEEVQAAMRPIVGEDARILYGGSVKPGNISELMQQPDIDGVLVGGASLEVDSFTSIINY